MPAERIAMHKIRELLRFTYECALSHERIARALLWEEYVVVIELLLDIPRQGRALRCQVGLGRGIVFLNKVVKEGASRAVAFVARRTDTRTGFPPSRQRQHDRILARLSCCSA
jgi:hypothetical protein